MKTLKEKIEVMQAAERGEKIEVATAGSNVWVETPNPGWQWLDCDYRVAPPEPDEIPWSAIDQKWNWYARDALGEMYFYDDKPTMRDGHWCVSNSGGSYSRCAIVVVKNNGANWRDSLQQRP